MDFLHNAYWCSDSIWGGDYNCEYIVSIEKFVGEEDFQKDPPNIDFQNCIEETSFFSEKKYQEQLNIFSKHLKENDKLNDEKIEEISKEVSMIQTYRLKPDIVKWLEDNVTDRKDPYCNKGWSVGTDKYNSINVTSFDIFFHRKADAMKFIKTFSLYKKPTMIFDSFNDKKEKMQHSDIKKITEKFVASLDAKSKLKISEKYLSFSEI